MYIARFRGEERSMVQAVARIRLVAAEPPGERKGWWAGFRSAVDTLMASPGVDFAFRVHVCSRRLERVLVLIAPEEREDQVEWLLGGLLRLNAVLPDSVEVCPDRSQHDELLGSFPENRLRVLNDPYSFGDCKLVSDFRFFPLLESVLGLALDRNWDIAFQVHAHRYHPAVEDRRVVKRNLVFLESERRIPAGLVRLEREIAERLILASFLVDEFLGAGSEQALRCLWERTQEEFTTAFGRLGFSGPPLEEDPENGFEESLFTGFHSSFFQEPDPMAVAGMAWSAEAVREMVTWQPPASWNSGLLSNVQVVSEEERDYLKRIDLRLAQLERSIQERSASVHEYGELKKALGISRADPLFALAKTRQILEGIVERVYRDQKPGQKAKPLFNMIEELTTNSSVFPRHIVAYLHSIRILGNLVVHPGSRPAEAEEDERKLSEADVELALLMTLNLVEWYLFEYQSR